jgi:glutamate dehydrogenase
VARGFVIADGAFGLSALKTRIDMLDGKVDAASQNRLYAQIAAHIQRVTPWFLARDAADLAGAIAQARAGTEALRASLPDDDAAAWTDAGLPADLARDLALLPGLAAAPDIARLAHDTKADLKAVTSLYAAVADRLGLERLRGLADKLNLPEHWDRLAVRRLLDDLSAAQASLTEKLLDDRAAGPAALEAWTQAHQDRLARMQDFLAALESSGELSVAKLMLASSQIQNLS